MKKYICDYREVIVHVMEVEADSFEGAYEKFLDDINEGFLPDGECIKTDISINEVKETGR